METSKKIIFFTRRKEDYTSPVFLRTAKLMELFKATFNLDVELINCYSETNKLNEIKQTNKTVEDFVNSNRRDIEIIAISSLTPKSIKMLEKYCLKNNIKLYIDIVELADAKEKKFGVLSPSYVMNHHIVKKSVTKNMTAIVISHYFEKYYANKNINTVYIPNLYSETYESKEIVVNKSDKTKFCFVGYPHKKDAIEYIFKALIELNKNRTGEFEFYIAGISEDELFAKYKSLRDFKSTIDEFTKFYGKVDRGEIKEIYQEIDYSIIMRDPNLVVCQSGFPTKFVESLSFGRPVIANGTSDILCYLKDGYNGYVVNDFSTKSLADTLNKVLDNKNASDSIYESAHASAKEYFGINNYVKPLRESYEKDHK